MEKITTFKGFDADLKCRDYRYKTGETYHHEGEVKACAGGFHACEYPLDVFSYYHPAGNRFCIVEQYGDISRHGDDSKIASSRITVKAEINLADMVKAAIEYTVSKADPVKTKHSTGHRSASSATGDQSASSATGDQSASSATGYQSASSATGDQSASEITPHNDGKPLHAVAAAFGEGSKARAPEGSAIVCVYRNDAGELIHIRASKIGDNGLLPNVWYTLDESGEFVTA